MVRLGQSNADNEAGALVLQSPYRRSQGRHWPPVLVPLQQKNAPELTSPSDDAPRFGTHIEEAVVLVGQPRRLLQSPNRPARNSA